MEIKYTTEYTFYIKGEDKIQEKELIEQIENHFKKMGFHITNILHDEETWSVLVVYTTAQDISPEEIVNIVK